MFTIANTLKSAINWYYGANPVKTQVAQVALDASSTHPLYQITQDLTSRVITPLNVPASDAHDEASPSLSAKAIWQASQCKYSSQLQLFTKHPILGPMCDGLIEKQLKRTPLPLNQVTNESIQITPKIKVLAIKRALQHEANVAAADISNLSLNSTESIHEALQRIKEGQDAALIAFFSHLRENIADPNLNEIFDLEGQEPGEQAVAIRRWIEANQEKLDGIYEIDLMLKQLRAVPPEIRFFYNLTSLQLYDNQITAIPDAIGKLANLTSLDLGHNQITAIPDAIEQLANLQHLDLSHNQITAIPDAIGQLRQLNALNLSFNEITIIPDAIRQRITQHIYFLS